MSDFRSQKLNELFMHCAAEFVALNSNRTSLITVTNFILSDDEKRATIFITVLPTDKEKGALDFLKRQRPEMREYIKSKVRTRAIPFVDFVIDNGEKNRQKIDLLSLN